MDTAPSIFPVLEYFCWINFQSTLWDIFATFCSFVTWSSNSTSLSVHLNASCELVTGCIQMLFIQPCAEWCAIHNKSCMCFQAFCGLSKCFENSSVYARKQCVFGRTKTEHFKNVLVWTGCSYICRQGANYEQQSKTNGITKSKCIP